MPSMKRKQTDIRPYFDKENVPNEDEHIPLKKKQRGLRCFKTQTRPPLGARDTNVGISLPNRPQPFLIGTAANPNVTRCVDVEMISDEDEDRKVPLFEDRPENLCPSTGKVVDHFPKTYKSRSPIQEKRQVGIGGLPDGVSQSVRCPPKAAEPPACDDQTLEITEALAYFKLDSPKMSDKDFLGLLKEIGRSVCRIEGIRILQGTGTALFGWIILTNAHLFSGCMDGRKLLDPINVFVVFELESRNLWCTVDKTFVYFDEELDSAFIRLIPLDPTAEPPPGLLKRLGPVPEGGRIGLVGYPNGVQKKCKDTSIIVAENREGALTSHLKLPLTKNSFNHPTKTMEPIDILIGGRMEKQVITYRSEMYKGSSGSPVFDGHRKWIALHTGGFQSLESKKWVLEYGYKLPRIIKKFVSYLKQNREFQLLERLRMEVLGNKFLTGLLQGAEEKMR